jgi:hypothetical protein
MLMAKFRNGFRGGNVFKIFHGLDFLHTLSATPPVIALNLRFVSALAT